MGKDNWIFYVVRLLVGAFFGLFSLLFLVGKVGETVVDTLCLEIVYLQSYYLMIPNFSPSNFLGSNGLSLIDLIPFIK